MDKRIRSKLVTKMMGVLDETAKALITIHVSSGYSFFIAIKLVGAEIATIVSTVAIDFLLHSKTTHDIIKDFRKIRDVVYGKESHTGITILILGELIEGLTPLIYGICVAMAYYGPNADILSSVGNNYWSQKIEDISPLFGTMFILFGVDTISVLFNALYLWKTMHVNMITEFSKVLNKYRYFLAVALSLNMVMYIANIDINLGMDGTQSYLWTSKEGWIYLVNATKELTVEEKSKLLGQMTLR